VSLPVVTLPVAAAWAWIPIVLWAAFAQTVRNAAQRTLTTQVGTLPATLVRFLYGLPFACAWVLLAWQLDESAARPGFAWAWAGWLAFGAVAQLGATALLLMAMKERNFIVAVSFSKTEVLQVALFGTLFLHELPGWVGGAAMLLATVGVVMLSAPTSDAKGQGWLTAAAAMGLGSGALFAFSAVGYRGAALTQTGVSPWLVGAWGVMSAQLLQSVLLGGYLAVRSPQGLVAIAKAWRLSLMAGTMGAMASIGWFTAFALRPAADVRTLGLVEVLFSYLVSRKLFKEGLTRVEQVGLALVAAGLVGVCSQL
jgi:drug/metabolite transporter (DMT)-like permease